MIHGEHTRIWLCGKRVPGPDPQAALDRVSGDVSILCLCQPHEIDERYPEYLAWLEANADDRALWHPVPDLSAPPIEKAQTIASSLNAELDAGRSVIVHCGAGMGRAPTIAICALLARGHALDTVLAAVADSRPMAGPETGSQRDLVESLGAAS